MTTVATFTVDYTRYLDPDSQLVSSLPAFAENSENLLSLYRLMTLTRTFDTKAIALQRTGKMGTYASCLGQEAVFAGIGFALEPTDVYVPYYRDYATLLQRGVKITEFLTFWGGDEGGNNFANNKEDMPFCVPIASQCLHAAGIAKAIQYRRQKRAVAVCIGEGGTSEGDFYEAINVAGAWKLPVVFIVNNNQWAISVSRTLQTGASTIAQKAIAAGLPGVQVDGNDVIAVADAVSRALTKARNGEGATVIEAITYRLCDHTTADDASRYVPAEELQRAHAEEPLRRLRHYLANQGHWSEPQEKALIQECQAQVQTEVDAYLSRTPPPVTNMFDYHYAELPDGLLEQRAEAEEEVQHG